MSENNGPEIPSFMFEGAKEKVNKQYNYVNLPKRDLGSGNPVLDPKDLLNIVKDDIKTSIPGESKIIEGDFPKSSQQKGEGKMKNIISTVKKEILYHLGFEEEGEEVEDEVQTEPIKTQKATEKGKVISIDFRKKK